MNPPPAADRRPLELPPSCGEPRADALRRLVAIVDRLRDPDGCAWDREQTLETLSPHLIEEAHELQEAIEAGRDDEIVEEAGDLLMGIVLVARTAADAQRFDLARVAEAVGDKLIRRHPHVFEDARADDAQAALANWEDKKREERRAKSAAGEDVSALDGVPLALPALQRARRVAEKAIASGFRWSSPRGALDKVREELGELREALGPDLDASGDEARAEIEAELGDLLLATAFLGTYLDLDPEKAARTSLRRFEQRFRRMEQELGGELGDRPEAEWVRAWNEAKRALEPVPEPVPDNGSSDSGDSP